MRRSIATVCLSGTLDEKLAAAAARRLRRRRALRGRPDQLAARPGEVRELAAELGLAIDLYQPFRDFEAVPGRDFERNLRRAEAKFDVMEELGAPTMLVCSNVSAEAIDDDALAAEQLRALAERAAERGLRIAYEALAWGRHVSEYDHAWRIVEAADHPALGTCLDSFHILSRGTDLDAIAAIPGEKIFFLQLADAPHLTHGRAAVEPPLPLLPGPGRVRPRRLRSRRVLAAGYAARCRSRSSTTSSARPTPTARPSTRCAR